jgi:hypothetical protein
MSMSNARMVPSGLRAAGIAAACALAACARVVAPPAPRAVMVNVPVLHTVYCAAPELKPPTLALASLGADSPPADTMRSYVASVMVLKSAVRERDAILRGCGAPAEGESAVTADASPQTSAGAAGGVASAPGVAAVSAEKASGGGKSGGGFVGAVAALVGKILRPLKASW